MKNRITHIWKFLTYDIWRITEDEVTKRKFSLYTIIKTIYICVDRFQKDRISNRASALTYSTLLAIVPILAVFFAIARGFGVSSFMEQTLLNGFGGKTETTTTIINFVNSYLSQTKGGIFIGIGLIMLLWTVIRLINNIEITFNKIWEVKKARSMYRKITDYFSMLLLLPILIVISGGVSIFISTFLKDITNFAMLAPFVKFLIRLVPFAITWFMFTGLFIFMPNTNVKFRYAFISSIIVGTVYQLFQYFYINSQVSVSKYNAIYGSFAALPLFLLWLHISWTICLFGVELTYAQQNIQNFNFEKDTRNISRRYHDFITILVMSLITKRFQKSLPPYTAEQLSREHRIPIRLTRNVIFELQQLDLINEIVTDRKSDDIAYQPSVDINQINVATVLKKLDQYGSENFKIDKEEEFNDEWKVLLNTREEYYNRASEILLKDL